VHVGKSDGMMAEISGATGSCHRSGFFWVCEVWDINRSSTTHGRAWEVCKELPVMNRHPGERFSLEAYA